MKQRTKLILLCSGILALVAVFGYISIHTQCTRYSSKKWRWEGKIEVYDAACEQMEWVK